LLVKLCVGFNVDNAICFADANFHVASAVQFNLPNPMSATLIALVGVVYAFIAANLYLSGKPGLALAFAGYAVSNVGLYLEAR
jgi:hypothetical protein